MVVSSILIDGATSLKDRRQVVKSLIERMRSRFGASCSDLGPHDAHERADMAFICVGSSSNEVAHRVNEMCGLIDRMSDDGGFEPYDITHEVWCYDDI